MKLKEIETKEVSNQKNVYTLTDKIHKNGKEKKLKKGYKHNENNWNKTE